MSLPYPDCHLFHPGAPRHNERPTDKNLILLLPLIHPAHEHTLQAFLRAYISSFRGQTDVSLVLYMPEPHYNIETLEQWLEAEGAPETQPDIELMLDPMLASAEPELYLNADAVIALEADSALMLKVLALNRKMLCFGDLPTALPFENWVHLLTTQNLSSSLQQLYTERERMPYSRPWVLEHQQQQLLAEAKGLSLIYVPSQRHLEHLGNTADYLMLTDDFETYVQCLEKSLPCLLAQSFLDQGPQLYEGDEASQIARSWHQGELAIDFHGHNLIEHCQYDLWYTFRGCLHMATVFESIYANYQPTQLFLFDEFVQPQFWDPAAGPFPDPKNAVLAFLAEQRGLSWQKIPPPPRGPIRSQSTSQIPESKTNTPETWFLTPDKIKQLKSSYRHVILGIGSHLDLAEQGLLAEDLWQREDTLYLFLRTYPFPVDAPSACFADLSFFLSHPELEPEIQALKQTIQTQWQAFISTSGPAAENWPFLFANPYFRFQLEHFLVSLLEAARHIFAAEQLVRLFKPVLCLLGNGASGTMRSLTASLNQQQVITYRIFHGLQPTSELCSPVTRFVLKGEHSLQYIQDRQISKSCVVIGDLRKPQSADTDISLQANIELSKLRQFKQERPMLLLLTSHLNYGLYTGQHSLQSHLEHWNHLVTLANKHPEWCFAIKHHPRYDFPGFYEHVAQAADNIMLLDTGLNYKILSPFVDACLLVYAFSSVIYEVYASQKPAIFYSDLDNPFYTASLRISQKDEVLEQHLQAFLNHPEKRAKLIKEQNQYLSTLVKGDYQTAYQALRQLLENDLKDTDQNLAPDAEAIVQLQLSQALTATQLTRNAHYWNQATAALAHLNSDTIRSLCHHHSHLLGLQ